MPPNLRAGVCVGAAIFRQETLLLLRRVPDFPGAWEIPGGSVEAGETLEGALQREVREETGFSVVPGRPFASAMFEATGPDGRPVTVIAIEFLCRTSSRADPRLAPEEHDGFAWAGEEDWRRYRIVPAFAQVIPEAFRAHRRESPSRASRARRPRRVAPA